MSVLLEIIEKGLSARGISASKASEKAVGHTSLVKNIKNGQVPSFENVQKLFNVLGIDMTFSIDGVEVNSPNFSQDVVKKTESEMVLHHARSVAELIAMACNKKRSFNYDPVDFGEKFEEMVRHSLEEQASNDEMGVIVDFQLGKSRHR